MYLVKDLVGGRIVYFWQDKNGSPRSDFFSTFLNAEEWWKTHVFALYAGVERRTSIIDRRTNYDKRRRLDHSHRFASSNPNGRRITDLPVKVSRDLAAEKLQGR
ncbi:hypothetical protein [Marinobacterium lutimaris]|uniref:Uncharacterized protein n=1 Tax=Marinobacterium lutimaris TaxID=568106 RepID=A0A1H6CUG9_9GAMM|nr:hypothetical protein [Marinobacterium lutimaris]SEG76175.1 hypothetical protein SAMN05444390_104129 [Marinobacterium lutimaris]